jgi:glycosyltransferase involved in cell wall biosynthesis
VKVEGIDEKFSTTRRLTKVPPNSSKFVNDMSSHLNLASHQERNGEGGLRTIGLFKSDEIEPIITVITVVFNAGRGLEETILSVLNQTYSNIEYIVIDGGSTDETREILNKYDRAIDYWVSEPDRGIYDAMNKGIKASSGDWLNFLNAKDRFYSTQTIQVLADNYLQGAAKFIYSDVLLTTGGNSKKIEMMPRHICKHESLIINHQAAIYRKSLHLDHGLYLVAPGLTISDYIFFSLIDRNNYLKADDPIAIYDTTGVTQSKSSSEQQFIIDYLLNGMKKHRFILYFCLYYQYKKIKHILSMN